MHTYTTCIHTYIHTYIHRGDGTYCDWSFARRSEVVASDDNMHARNIESDVTTSSSELRGLGARDALVTVSDNDMHARNMQSDVSTSSSDQMILGVRDALVTSLAQAQDWYSGARRQIGGMLLRFFVCIYMFLYVYVHGCA